MLEVLVFLFENYYHAEGYPDHATLARTLTAAGFENDDIHDALDWLEHLAGRTEETFPEQFDSHESFRSYSVQELAKLSVDSRGFIAFLESAGVLTPLLRELIIERAMALPERVVEVGSLKVIVLMVIWTRRGDVDTLVLEELLPDGTERQIH